jgi:hypothetical protein
MDPEMRRYLHELLPVLHREGEQTRAECAETRLRVHGVRMRARLARTRSAALTSSVARRRAG